MLVGFMADIPFVVSSRYIRTFDDYSRGSGGRWAQHDIIGDKPVLEYLGPDVEKISFITQPAQLFKLAGCVIMARFFRWSSAVTW